MSIKQIIIFVKENKILVLSAILFVTASHICTLIFDDVAKWWWLRAVFYSLQNYLGFWIAMQFADKINLSAGAFCCAMCGISLSDVFDKIGKQYNYTWCDGPVIILTIIYTIKKYVNKQDTSLHS